MNWIYFKLCALDNTWAMLAPEIMLVCMGILLLATAWFFPKNQQPGVVHLFTNLTLVLVSTVLLLKVLFVPSIGIWLGFASLIAQTPATDIIRLFFLLSGMLTVHLAHGYFQKNPHLDPRPFYPVLLWVIAGFMTLVQAHHFVSFFVLLELVTAGFYVLVAYNRWTVPSLEAGLKYLVLGAMGSAILLFGIALLYGISGNPNLPGSVTDGMNFSALHVFVSANANEPLVWMGALMVLIGIAFKVGAVPLQIWIPDVYQGAPLPVVGLLAVASKATGIVLLMNLLYGPFAGLARFLMPIVVGIGIITILFGNITAVAQRSTKRLIGLSGISHAGYLILGVVAGFYIEWGSRVVFFYLFTYLLATYVVLSVIQWISLKDDTFQVVDEFQGLAENDGFVAMALTVALGSLAGIPPLAGFVAKFLLLIAIFDAGLYWGLAAAICGVVISIYYYFGWIRSAVFKPWQVLPQQRDSEVMPMVLTRSGRWILGLLTALTVVIGFFPGIFGVWIA